MAHLKILGREESTWWDVEFRRNIHGFVYRYEFADEHIGIWEIEVRIGQDPPKATVSVFSPEHSGNIYDQLARKKLVFQQCPGNKELFYHPLGIAYVEKGRVRRKRVPSLDAAPSSIKFAKRLIYISHIMLNKHNI